jgi:hypothetical protein
LRRVLRLKTLAIVPIAVISMLAATTSVAAAATPADPSVSAAVAFAPQAPVNLGSAGDFTILSKTGITDVHASAVVGNVGTSPITGAALLLTCDEVTGYIYTVDAAGPLPCRGTGATRLTSAIGDMETAYNDAAGRTNPDVLNLGAGEIGGHTLAPGLYKWTSNVSMSGDVTLAGGPNDVWILQVAGTLTEAHAKNVILTGAAQAKNVFWQTADGVEIGTQAHFEGTILSKTMIAMKTKASIVGRLFAQTAVTLQMNTITRPLCKAAKIYVAGTEMTLSSWYQLVFVCALGAGSARASAEHHRERFARTPMTAIRPRLLTYASWICAMG